LQSDGKKIGLEIRTSEWPVLMKACQMPGQPGRFARNSPSISEIHAVG
jgi:hypothetical protein